MCRIVGFAPANVWRMEKTVAGSLNVISVFSFSSRTRQAIHRFVICAISILMLRKIHDPMAGWTTKMRSASTKDAFTACRGPTMTVIG